MKPTLEQELINTLETGARQVAEPDGALFANVARLVKRRRRRRRLTAVASVAVLVAVVGGSLPLMGRHVQPAPPSVPPDLSATYPLTVPDFDNAPNVADVWPEAVRTLPLTLPGGGRYVVQAVLPHGRYVVLNYSERLPGFRLDRPSVFDPGAGTVRELAPADASTSIIGLGVIGSNAVWATTPLGATGTTTEYEVWTASLAGGAASKLITLQHEDNQFTGSLTIAGNSVMWDRYEAVKVDGKGQRRSVGIYRLPLSGGQPQLVAGTQGYRVTSGYAGWGGASAVAMRNGTETTTPSGWTTDDPADAPLFDLTRSVPVPWSRAPEVDTGPMGYMECGLLGCTGRRDGAPNPANPVTAFVQRRDGSGYLEVGDKDIGPVGDGRFLKLEYSAGPTSGRRLVVWDRKSATAASCGVPVSDGFIRPDLLELGRPFVTWTEGSTMKLLDITAIE
ncbi:hypothetical protein ACFO1B_35595 [Dactylosporangium siamense]|uniref:Uncharacterized protein n=1 Tax=Dactylosporangium siamense TaxID=685454 RepID=A0A919PJC6_9ACTN|nr:hypothetical protein [Dactylosporangium siamense]GIG45900.1 hypothetical protein Dsi01nite_039410 [Dactylosporangium siamense]